MTLLNQNSFISCAKLRWRWKEQFKTTSEFEKISEEIEKTQWPKNHYQDLMAAAARLSGGSAFGIDRTIVFIAHWPLVTLSNSFQTQLGDGTELAKRVAFPGVDWEDPRGLLPPQAHLNVDTPTGNLFLTFSVTEMDYCYSDKTVHLDVGDTSLSAEWRTDETD